jgi:all-trans-retinol 13,14-reductase
MTGVFDDVVAGSGFGGLTTAILLAQMGRKVALVEAAARPGGLLRSYRRAGVDCPVGVHYFGAAAKDELLGQLFELLHVRDALRLHRMGQEGVIDRYVFDDWTFDLPPTVDLFEASLRERFPEQGGAIDFVAAALRATVSSMRIGPEGRVTGPDLPGVGFGATAADVLLGRGCAGGMLDIIGMTGFLTGVGLDEAVVQFPFMSLGSLLASAWELGCTGADMADALADRARETGVQVVMGDAVQAIVVEAGRAAGVRLESGSVLSARSVVANMHPKTLVELVPAESWPESYAAGIRGVQETLGLFTLVALVDERELPARQHNLFRVRRRPDGSLDGVYVQLRRSSVAGRTRMVLLGRSEYDDWRAWHDTRTGSRGPDYEARKMEIGRLLLEHAEEVVGPVKSAEILDTWTPLTVRDFVRAPRGGAYGIRHSTRNLRYFAMTRTALDGLTTVGQSALAPGLVGVTLGVLRAIGAIVGSAALRAYLREAL